MTEAVPAERPAVITPVEPIMVAPPVLVQVPPPVASVSVVDAPVHIVNAPPIAPGAALTLNTCVTKQPAMVYETVAVPTEAPPVTTPVDPMTVASPVTLHVPPLLPSEKVIFEFSHTLVAPEIEAGPVTLTVVVTLHKPPIV